MMDMNSKAIGSRLQNGALTSEQVGAYNIYKGARYVPKIMGQWDANVNYEPLSIVINQGNSYTSAQYVPAGVPLQENGPYWFLTGSFNGQIASVQQQVEQNTQNIEANSNNISTLSDDINRLKNVVHEEHYYVFIGDSYATMYTGITQPWPNLIANYLGLSADNYRIVANGGRGFGIPDETNNVINSYKTFLNNNPEYAEKITDIIIALGINDGNYTSGLLSKVKNQLLQIKALNPYANIELYMIGNANNNWETPAKLDNIYVEAAFETGVKNVPLIFYSWMGNNCFDNSKYHPSQTGQYYLSYALAEAIISKERYMYPLTLSLAITPNDTTAVINLNLYINTLTTSIIGTINIPNLTTGEIGTFNITPYGVIWTATSTKGVFQIVNNKLYYRGSESSINETVQFTLSNLV